jgi:dihydroorotate dehydrogenase
MYTLLRPLLFKLNPERAHNITLALLRVAGMLKPLRNTLQDFFALPDSPKVHTLGLTFRNPVGLAAGYDKDGLAWRGLSCLGFGHIEIGTVTPKPQKGNPKPRIFRLTEDNAIINRMGFPGKGADFVAQRLSGSRDRNLVIGVNIGKNKDTPLETAYEDYIKLVDKFAPLADYLAINISSPNTIGLRRLQNRDYLENLLGHIVARRDAHLQEQNKRIPLLVKLAPDLSEEELDDALEIIIDHEIDGLIATNTTVKRDGLSSSLSKEQGGLSGAPLTKTSTEMVERISQRTQGKLPIIAAGGIMDADDAREKLNAGATLVQVYTGLVYRGPGLVKEIISSL